MANAIIDALPKTQIDVLDISFNNAEDSDEVFQRLGKAVAQSGLRALDISGYTIYPYPEGRLTSFDTSSVRALSPSPFRTGYLREKDIQARSIPRFGVNPRTSEARHAFGSQNTHTGSTQNSFQKFFLGLGEKYPDVDIAKKKDLLRRVILKLSDVHKEAPRVVNGIANQKFKLNTALGYLDSVPSRPELLNRCSISRLIAFIMVAADHKSDLHPNVSSRSVYNNLIDGLYEAARGGNMNQIHHDDGHEISRSVCYQGQFNKICEKMVGVLKRVNMTLISPQVVTYYYQNKVLDEIRNFVNTEKNGANMAREILENDTELLPEHWEVIEPRVRQAVVENFEALLLDGVSVNDTRQNGVQINDFYENQAFGSYETARYVNLETLFGRQAADVN